MDITVLNKSLIKVDVIDVYESLLWIDRFNDYGTFELMVPVTLRMIESLQEDYYLSIKNSATLMIIESIEIKTDAELGPRLYIRGRSLISILDRRIVLGQTFIDGSLHAAFLQITNENVISSSQPNRNIPRVIFDSTIDPGINALTLEAQYDGDNLWDVFHYLAKLHDFGMKMDFDANSNFSFGLYPGVDRSYAQSTNSYVVFSPEYDNLLNSSFYQSKQYKKTYTLVYGDPSSGPAHRVEAYELPTAVSIPLTGLDRRETKTDASDLSKFFAGTTTEIPVPDYVAQLKARGWADLKQRWNYISEFEGQIDTVNSYVYRVDYFLGDIIQIANEYGFETRSRITEITISENRNGSHIFPTFTKL